MKAKVQYYTDSKTASLFVGSSLVCEIEGPRSNVARFMGLKHPNWKRASWGWYINLELRQKYDGSRSAA